MQIGENIPEWLAGLAYVSFFLFLVSSFAFLFYSPFNFFQKSWLGQQSTNTTVQAHWLCAWDKAAHMGMLHWAMVYDDTCLSQETSGQEDVVTQTNDAVMTNPNYICDSSLRSKNEIYTLTVIYLF